MLENHLSTISCGHFKTWPFLFLGTSTEQFVALNQDGKHIKDTDMFVKLRLVHVQEFLGSLCQLLVTQKKSTLWFQTTISNFQPCQQKQKANKKNTHTFLVSATLTFFFIYRWMYQPTYTIVKGSMADGDRRSQKGVLFRNGAMINQDLDGSWRCAIDPFQVVQWLHCGYPRALRGPVACRAKSCKANALEKK